MVVYLDFYFIIHFCINFFCVLFTLEFRQKQGKKLLEIPHQENLVLEILHLEILLRELHLEILQEKPLQKHRLPDQRKWLFRKKQKMQQGHILP